MKTVAFFNNKGGVGKTSLVYHLAWMFALNSVKTLAVDLDPQANLTAMFLDEDRLENLWAGDEHPDTIYGSIRPILKGTGDIKLPRTEQIAPLLKLLPGDLGLSKFEDRLSDAWPRCHGGEPEAAFRTMTAFHRLIQSSAGNNTAITLIDVGPNLGAINRAALIASDQVCVPLAPDLFSIQGLKNLGPTLQEWRKNWVELKSKAPTDVSTPSGGMKPIGYVVMQHGISGNKPGKAYQKWLNKIPNTYETAVLNRADQAGLTIENDSNCISLLKHYRSLMPLAMEARKPIFLLKPADGAIGAHGEAVQSCYVDFKLLAGKIADAAGVQFPAST